MAIQVSRSGYVYFLLNSAMPGLVKVGFTTGPVEDRMRELHTSGVPEPFILGAAFAVQDPEECEGAIHSALASVRVTEQREFFRVSLDEALNRAFPVIKPCLSSTALHSPPSPRESTLPLTEDDIYFLQFILHDGQSEGRLLSTEKLKEHHTDYHVLELERLLLGLEEQGLIQRVSKRNDVRSYWRMSPFGVNYMLERGLAIQDLLDEKGS